MVGSQQATLSCTFTSTDFLPLMNDHTASKTAKMQLPLAECCSSRCVESLEKSSAALTNVPAAESAATDQRPFSISAQFKLIFWRHDLLEFTVTHADENYRSCPCGLYPYI